jgi:hypothetical protein
MELQNAVATLDENEAVGVIVLMTEVFNDVAHPTNVPLATNFCPLHGFAIIEETLGRELAFQPQDIGTPEFDAYVQGMSDFLDYLAVKASPVGSILSDDDFEDDELEEQELEDEQGYDYVEIGQPGAPRAIPVVLKVAAVIVGLAFVSAFFAPLF